MNFSQNSEFRCFFSQNSEFRCFFSQNSGFCVFQPEQWFWCFFSQNSGFGVFSARTVVFGVFLPEQWFLVYFYQNSGFWCVFGLKISGFFGVFWPENQWFLVFLLVFLVPDCGRHSGKLAKLAKSVKNSEKQ